MLISQLIPRSPHAPSSFARLQEKLPAAKPGGEPIPEGLLWLLMTGDVSPLSLAASLQSLRACSPASSPMGCSRRADPPAPPAEPHAAPAPALLLPSLPARPQMPTAEQAKSVTEELRARSTVPDHVYKVD